MNSVYHARSSAAKWGGSWRDYIAIHNFLDQSKGTFGDVRHRAMLHHTLGCMIAEQVFGPVITNSDGREVPTREIAEQHIVEDLGWLPTPGDYLKTISLAAVPWIGGRSKKVIEKASHDIRSNISACKKVRKTAAGVQKSTECSEGA